MRFPQNHLVAAGAMLALVGARAALASDLPAADIVQRGGIATLSTVDQSVACAAYFSVLAERAKVEGDQQRYVIAINRTRQNIDSARTSYSEQEIYRHMLPRFVTAIKSLRPSYEQPLSQLCG